MDIKNGLEYGSNYARAAAYFRATCAPEPEGENRRAAFRLVTGIYELAFCEPETLGFKPQADVHFEPWEQQRGREKDVKAIRDPIAKLEALIKELFDIVEASDASGDALVLRVGAAGPGRALIKALSRLGCTVEESGLRLPAGCAEGLRELAAVSRQNVIHITDGPKEDKAYLYFSRCVFEPEDNWTARAFDALLDAKGELIRLAGELEARGFSRVDCRDGKRVSLDYVRQYGKKDEPLKAAWGERTHSGIEVSFEELRLEPCFVWLRLPQYRLVLESLAELPAAAADFLVRNTKTCDGCRYCVQTDKTGARPLAAVECGSKFKCPMFPGFTFNRRSLDRELADSILLTLDALDALPALAGSRK